MPDRNLVYNGWRSVSRIIVPILMLFLLIGGLMMGCQSSGDAHSNVNLDWEIEPDPPGVGMATIQITLTDSTEQAITGAEVELEGNMSHPGMQPVLAKAEEIEPGKYSATIKFTMAGDWFFLIDSTLPDNGVVEHQIDIRGVRSQ